MMVPLIRAYLCLDDDTVFDGGTASPARACPQCAGRTVVQLQWLLERKRRIVVTPREVVALASIASVRRHPGSPEEDHV